LAARYESFLSAGVRLAAIDVDSPAQHAAMVSKLDLPFAYLSDSDRAGAIQPFGLSNPDDPRNLAYPALVLLDPEGAEVWRWVSRDFADRMPEDDVVEVVGGYGWAPVAGEAIEIGLAEPGPRAMPFEGLSFYLRGARFAALAMGLRHGHHDPSIKADSKEYVAEMDRFLADYAALKERRG